MSACIVQQLHENMKQKSIAGKILISAPSNTAADNLADVIDKNYPDIKVLRICSRRMQLLMTSVDHLTLHYQVKSC